MNAYALLWTVNVMAVGAAASDDRLAYVTLHTAFAGSPVSVKVAVALIWFEASALDPCATLNGGPCIAMTKATSMTAAKAAARPFPRSIEPLGTLSFIIR